MRVVFMGTPDFSVPALQALIDHHKVEAVVTQPDKPKGRGKAMQYPPVKEKALEYHIPVYQPVKVRGDEGFLEQLKEINPDIIVVIAFGQILPEEVLNLPKYGCINVHASLLPKYRGAAPIAWSVIDGETETGVTTMYMAKGLDTGDMIDKVVLPISPTETEGSLRDKLKDAGASLLLETLNKIAANTAIRIPQDDSLSCYAKMLDKTLGNIDWNQDAAVIERLIRGLNPWPSAYTKLDNKTFKIWKAQVVCEQTKETPGSIIRVTKDSIVVQMGSNCLALYEIQLEGKKRMKVDAFLLGYEVNAGNQLG